MILANLYFWFDAGILGEKPPLFDLPDSYLINAGVTWTLFWEWAFYFSLPIVCLVRDKIGVIKLALAIIFISVYMIYPLQPAWAVYIALFAIGGLVKELPKKTTNTKEYMRYRYCADNNIFIFMFRWFL